ncbi:hypothetical protein ACHEUQ_03115 [Alloscardovia omnicolens]|uniref:hypothetical protein n=1 Tax=Alloscardovia omnicolens TaxID=419015 RepID=UPI0006686562|nr:hypothetical protein [Alloscardovia omnicolens]
MSIHSTLADYIDEHKPQGYEVKWVIPKSMNTNNTLGSKLIIIEQTGASFDEHEQSAILAIDVFASTLRTAENNAYKIAKLINQCVQDATALIACDIMSIYNNPLLDSKYPRYTITVTIRADTHHLT